MALSLLKALIWFSFAGISVHSLKYRCTHVVGEYQYKQQQLRLSHAIIPRCKYSEHSPFRRRIGSSLLMQFDDVGTGFYDLQLQLSNFITTELSSTNTFSVVILYIIGLFAAFSPCTFSMLPLTLAYLGQSDQASGTGDNKVATKAIFYALGLATIFSLLGLSAALFGQVFGSIGESSSVLTELGTISKFVISAIYVVMGLNLLDLVQVRFPSINLPGSTSSGNILESSGIDGSGSDIVEAFVFGASSALIETPCTSPILAALLTFVSALASADSSSGGASKLALGAIFLFIFSLGYATPLVAAGVASGSVIRNNVMASGSPWVINVFASALIAYGSYQCLESASFALI